MKRFFILFVVVLFVFVGFVFMVDDIWIGEVFDMKCYVNGQKGEGYVGCVKCCFEGGLDMGLFVGDDVVKVDMEVSDEGVIKMMIENGGKNVEIIGMVLIVDGEMIVVVKIVKVV